MLHAKTSAQTHTTAPHCGSHCHPAPRILTLHILPLQPCRYEQGDDARMLNCLTSSSVVRSVAIDDGWSPRSMLRTIARRTPAFHALI